MLRCAAHRLAVIVALVAFAPACALSLRNPHVADLRDNPGRYQHHSVSIDGVVTTAWSVPLLPIRLYKVDDGTGEVTVVSQGTRMPTRGARVRVKGRVNELGVFGGNAIGLHLEEEQLHVKR
jgi:hypothetical protein